MQIKICKMQTILRDIIPKLKRINMKTIYISVGKILLLSMKQ